jgi:transcriptional regulator with XRE-family HTH domain
MLRLRLWRLAKGLSQLEAARRLGMSQLTYGYLESGRLTVSEKLQRRLQTTFGSDAATILERVKDPVAS